jgi:hypothetical protein
VPENGSKGGLRSRDENRGRDRGLTPRRRNAPGYRREFRRIGAGGGTEGIAPCARTSLPPLPRASRLRSRGRLISPSSPMSRPSRSPTRPSMAARGGYHIVIITNRGTEPIEIRVGRGDRPSDSAYATLARGASASFVTLDSLFVSCAAKACRTPVEVNYSLRSEVGPRRATPQTDECAGKCASPFGRCHADRAPMGSAVSAAAGSSLRSRSSHSEAEARPASRS